MATVTNDRSGRSITTPYTHEEAAKLFAERYKAEPNHWLFYWLHDYAQRREPQVNNTPASAKGGNASAALKFLGDTFMVGIGYGLVRPRIRLHYKGRRYKFYMSRNGTVCLKTGALAPVPGDSALQNGDMKYHACSAAHPATCPGCVTEGHASHKHGDVVYGHDPVGDEVYAGCLLHGEFLPARQNTWGQYQEFDPTSSYHNSNSYQNRPVRQLLPDEREFLDKLCASPVSFLAECSRDMGQCCYCGNPLEDERSKLAGYGATCAKHYGLPWGDKEYLEAAPSFAKAYDGPGGNASGLLETIRKNPKDEGAWLVFADWLEEHGLPRCEMPKKTVVLPRS